MSRVWVHVQYSRVQYKVDNVNCLQSTGTLCTSVAREMGVIPKFRVLKFRISTSQNFHQCLGQFVLLSAQFSFNITRFNEYVILINSVNASCRNTFLGTSLSRRYVKFILYRKGRRSCFPSNYNNLDFSLPKCVHTFWELNEQRTYISTDMTQ
jgi:hypothetical protein